jgi:hypothetical protein
MDHALFRPNPSQLAVGDEPAPCGSHVFCELLEGAPEDTGRNCVDRGAHNVVAAPDGEGHAMPRERGVIGLEDTVG